MSIVSRRWPLVVRVPLLVAVLMLCVSAIVSFQVLSRLDDTQSRHLNALTSAYLDGISSAVMPHLLRDDTWEVFDNLERSKDLYRGLSVVATIVQRADRSVVASTDPQRFPTETRLAEEIETAPREAIRGDGALTWVSRDLQFQGRDVGRLLAAVDTSHIQAERREVLLALLASNAFLTTLLAAGGALLVRRMLGPVGILAARFGAGARGQLQPFTAREIGDPSTEFGHLFTRYNALTRGLNERETLAAKLAEEERMASLGRLSSVVAHEINNPLGGLLNAVDTLKRRGDTASVRQVAIGLLERGLQGIRGVVETTLAMYRPDRNQRPLRAADIDDLRLLVDGEARRRGVRLDWTNALPPQMSIASGPLRQALLNLVLNACQATPAGGEVRVSSRLQDGYVALTVTDGGSGLEEALRDFLLAANDDAPPRASGGIGLWMIRRLVREMNGRIRIEPGEPAGTRIELLIPGATREEIADVA